MSADFKKKYIGKQALHLKARRIRGQEHFFKAINKIINKDLIMDKLWKKTVYASREEEIVFRPQMM